jgi:ribonuclease HI
MSAALGRGTNNVGELYAIGMALDRVSTEVFEGKITPGTQMAVLTDSEYSLGVLTGTMTPKSNLELINWVKNKLAHVRKSNPVEFHWVPGHNGIEGNEKADRLAQDAATRSACGKQDASWPGGPKKAEPRRRRKAAASKPDQPEANVGPSLLSMVMNGDQGLEEKR